MQRAPILKLSTTYAFLAVILAVGAITLSGCKSRHADDASPIVTLVNAIPDSTGLNIIVGGRPVFTGPEYGAPAKSFRVDPGKYDVVVKELHRNSAQVTILRERLQLDLYHRYTFIAHRPARRSVTGKIRVLSSVVRKDAGSGGADLNVVNACANASRVDVSLNSIVSVSGVEFGAQSGLTALEPGTYQIAVLDSGSTYKLLSGPQDCQFEKGRNYLLVIGLNRADGGVSMQVLEN